MKLKPILFAVVAVALFAYFIYDVKQSKSERQEFIAQWSTALVATVNKTKIIESDAGVIYLNIDTISSKKHDIANYKGGPFYLLTSEKRAKLFEGGLSLIKPQDIVVIDDAGTFLVIREDEIIINKKIAFRSFAPTWGKVNKNSIKSHWNW
jgi:hypothetical protein